MAPVLVPSHSLNYLGDRVWRGVVEDAHFCTVGDFFLYARGRGIYANFFDLGADSSGLQRTHPLGLFPRGTPARQLGAAASAAQRAAPPRSPGQAASRSRCPDRRHAPPAAHGKLVLRHEPLPCIAQGRVALIGDAAHAMSSSQARGMTAGLEDALALARALAASPQDLPAALLAYQAEAYPYCITTKIAAGR